MGVDILIYRCRIGTFVMPLKCRTCIHGIRLSKGKIRLCVRALVALSLLLVVSGDVESNPGPGSGQEPLASQKPQTRQRQLSFAQVTASPPVLPVQQSPVLTPKPRYQRQPAAKGRGHTGAHTDQTGSSQTECTSQDIMKCLQDMRSEMRVNFLSINSKVDEINAVINDLQIKNEELKQENIKLNAEMSKLTSKIDNLEGHSRRNNVRITGIDGNSNENWSATEEKVRSFLSHELNLPELENVEIERAHRLKTGENNKATIIVKFLRFKDRDTVIRQARRVLGRNSPYHVHEDFTDRVRHHRRELGKRLAEARQNGLFASLQYDKLIVDSTMYGYDECKQTIYEIGPARRRPTALRNRGTDPVNQRTVNSSANSDANIRE